jgi:beta-galactosidase
MVVRKIMLFLLLPFYCFAVFAQNNGQSRTRLFDDNWRFTKDAVTNAEQPNYDDSKWRVLDLPHDWSIEDLPNQIPDSISGPFSKAAISQRDGGFLVGGTAWYRKHFVTEKASAGKQTYIQFDGRIAEAQRLHESRMSEIQILLRG